MTFVSLPLASFSLASLFLVSLVGALAPLFLAQRLHDSNFFRLADSFAAGVLASAAFVHLLPSAIETLNLALPDIDYPIAGGFALCGAIVVYLVDALADSPAPANTGYVLASALSLHAFLEGLALGASVMRRHTFAAILTAVLLHKGFASASLGAALVGAGVPLRNCAVIGITFASITPIAAICALLVVRSVLEPANAQIISAALSAASAGIFAYVAFAELIQNRQHHVASSSNATIPSPCVSNSLPRPSYGALSSAQRRANGSAGRELCSPKEEMGAVVPVGSVCKKCAPARAVVFVFAAAGMSVLAIWT